MTLTWLMVVGFVALLALILSVVVLVFLTRRRRFEPLPDGDYIVTVIGTRETPQGVATVFKVDEPKELRGRIVTIVKGKTE